MKIKTTQEDINKEIIFQLKEFIQNNIYEFESFLRIGDPELSDESNEYMRPLWKLNLNGWEAVMNKYGEGE